jgi:hypothetical protein
MDKLLRFATLALATAALAQTASIRQVDFRNFVYPWDDSGSSLSGWRWMKPSPRTRIRVTNGAYRFVEPGLSEFDAEGKPSLFVWSVTYGDIDGDQQEEAAVILNYSTGGTSNWKYLYLYKLVHGEPRLLGRLQGGDRAYGGLVNVAIENGLLVLDFNDPERRAGDCCSAGFIRVRYKWQQQHFVETGRREHGDFKIEEYRERPLPTTPLNPPPKPPE